MSQWRLPWKEDKMLIFVTLLRKAIWYSQDIPGTKSSYERTLLQNVKFRPIQVDKLGVNTNEDELIASLSFASIALNYKNM